MLPYIELGYKLLHTGHDHPDRTGVGRRSLFAQTLRFDLADGFPLLTTRQLDFNAIVEETLWFIRGSHHVPELQAKDVHFWDQWAVTDAAIESFIQQYLAPYFGEVLDETLLADTIRPRLQGFLGSIGPLYGPSWRSVPIPETLVCLNAFLPPHLLPPVASDKHALWTQEYQALPDTPHKPSLDEYLQSRQESEIDPLHALIIGLKERPWSSRHVLSTWLPERIALEAVSPAHNVLLGRGALAPCHVYQQYVVSPPEGSEGPLRLSLHLTQRSADYAIGCPVNIAQYSLLLSLVAQCVGMVPHEFHWCGVDVHLYANHLEPFTAQLQRQPYSRPTLRLNPAVTDLFAFTADDITLDDYHSHPAFRYSIAV